MFTLKKDFDFRPSNDLLMQANANLLTSKLNENIKLLSVDPSITDIEMRLHDVFVTDNRDPGDGDIYLLSVVADGISEEPFSLQVKTFQDIPDGAPLQLGPTGLTIYRNPQGKIPRYLDYRVLVMESDQEIRNAGEVLNEIRANQEYKDMRDSIIAATAAGNVAVGLITAGSDFVMGLISKLLMMNEDDQLIYIAGSFNDKIDDLGVPLGLIQHKNEYVRIKYKVHAV